MAKKELLSSGNLQTGSYSLGEYRTIQWQVSMRGLPEPSEEERPVLATNLARGLELFKGKWLIKKVNFCLVGEGKLHKLSTNITFWSSYGKWETFSATAQKEKAQLAQDFGELSQEVCQNILKKNREKF